LSAHASCPCGGGTTAKATEGDRDLHIVVLIEGPAGLVAAAEVPAGVHAAVTDDWIASWIRIPAQRLLSYASGGALA